MNESWHVCMRHGTHKGVSCQHILGAHTWIPGSSPTYCTHMQLLSVALSHTPSSLSRSRAKSNPENTVCLVLTLIRSLLANRHSTRQWITNSSPMSLGLSSWRLGSSSWAVDFSPENTFCLVLASTHCSCLQTVTVWGSESRTRAQWVWAWVRGPCSTGPEFVMH